MTVLTLVPEKRQRIWGWPAVVNLTMGGTGAGLYLLETLLASFNPPRSYDIQFIGFPLLAAAIVCLGFLTLSMEAGRPLRGYRLLSRLSGSWMSLESLAGVIFIVAAATNYWSPFVYLRVLAVMAAMVLIVSQGVMLYLAVGVKAWHHRLLPFLFVTSGLTTACGLLLLNTRQIQTLDRWPILLLLVLITLNLVLWFRYLNERNPSDSNRGFEFLRRPVLLILIGGVGHLLPMLYLGAVILFGNIENSVVTASLLRVGSGLMLLGGGVCQKIGIVMVAGFFRPILIDAEIKDNTLIPMR